MRKSILALVMLAPIGIAACDTATIQRDVAEVKVGADAVQAACAEALPLANLAVFIPTVGPFIATGVQVGCGTAAGIDKLASDPSSAAWLGQQSQMLKDALGRR